MFGEAAKERPECKIIYTQGLRAYGGPDGGEQSAGAVWRLTQPHAPHTQALATALTTFFIQGAELAGFSVPAAEFQCVEQVRLHDLKFRHGLRTSRSPGPHLLVGWIALELPVTHPTSRLRVL